MIMADDAEDAEDEADDAGGLDLLGGTRLLLLLPPPPLLLPLLMEAALLFDRLSCRLFLPDDLDAALPNDATELVDDIRRIPGMAVAGLQGWGCRRSIGVCAMLCWARVRIESNWLGMELNCYCRNVPEADVTVSAVIGADPEALTVKAQLRSPSLVSNSDGCAGK